MIQSRTTFADPHFREVTPVYRVDFWEATPGGAWGLEAVVLTGASDVDEVMHWVEDHRHGRRVELFVEIDGGPAVSEVVPRRYGLIRLKGEDPNDGVAVPLGTFIPAEGV